MGVDTGRLKRDWVKATFGVNLSGSQFRHLPRWARRRLSSKKGWPNRNIIHSYEYETWTGWPYKKVTRRCEYHATKGVRDYAT